MQSVKRLCLLLAFLILPISLKAQGGNTTVTAIVKDPTGILYTNSQVNITFVEPTTPGKIPLLNGSVFQKSFTIFATDSFGRFTVSLPDTGVIDSSSGTSLSKWSIRIIFSDRAISFVYVTPINCAANIPTTCTAGTIDITAQLQAVAANLPSSGGGGPASATIPMSTIGFTATPTFAATANAGYQMTLTGNVTSSTITGIPINGNLLAFNFIQDATGGRTVAFPGNFIIPPGFALDTAPNHPTYLLWKFDGTNWTLVMNIGGTGGTTAQPPLNSLQIDNAGILGGTQFIYNPTDTSGSNCNTQSCATLTENVDGGFAIFSTDGTNSIGFVAQGNVAPPGAQAGAQNFVETFITHGPQAISFAAQTQIGGVTSGLGGNAGSCFNDTVGSPSCGIAYQAYFGDANGDTNNGQDAIAFSAKPAMDKSAGHNMNSVAGFLMRTPGNYSSSKVPVTESAVNLWGLEIQDLQGIGTTQTIGIHIEPQTNPSSHSFAILAEANAGPTKLTDSVSSTFFASLSLNPATSGLLRLSNSDQIQWRNATNNANISIGDNGAASGTIPADTLFNNNGWTSTFYAGGSASSSVGLFRLSTGDTISWRNNAGNANLSLSKNASDNLIWPNSLSVGGTLLTGTGGGTATFPNNTGTVAELNVAQNFTVTPTFSSPLGVPSGGTGIATATLNGIVFGNGAGAFGVSAAGGAGTLCFVETNGGVPTWASCAGSASTSWSLLTNPSADLSLAMGVNNTLFTFGVMIGTRNAFEAVDGNSTSTGSLWSIHTGATSTMKPITITALGTANGVQMSSAGVLAKLGTGSISADVFTGLITVPLGGTGQTTLAANQLLSGNGAGAINSIAGSTTGTNPILKLQPSNAANTALILDTAASPTGDILDFNINGTKTSWFDSAGVLHTAQVTLGGSGPLVLNGALGTCPASLSAGFSLICLGDSTTSMAQLSNNGLNFKPIAQFSTASPAAHAVALASATAPQLTFTAAGTTGWPLLGQGALTDPIFAQVALNGANIGVTGVLQPVNGGIGATSLASANIITVTGAVTVGHCSQFQASTVIQDSGSPCGGGGGSPPLNTIIAATGTNTINNTTFSQVWNWALAGSTTAFKFTENIAATGSSNIILQATTAATSTAVPFQTDNNGKGWQLSSAGNWQALGGGTISIPASTVLPSGVAATTQTLGDSSTLLATDAFVANSIATFPFRLAVSDVTGQSTSQSPVTVATSPASGRYTITYYADQNAVCTTGANTVSFTFNWTDATNARSLSTGSLSLNSSQLTTGYMDGIIPIFVGSGNITYSSTVVGTCATGTSTYDVHVEVERNP